MNTVPAKLIIACDYDGTLHDPYNRRPGYKLGQPIAGAVEAMQQLKSAGHKLIIYTVWADTPDMKRAIAKWLDYFDVPYDGITNVKPDATYYIDDRAIRFENNWPEIVEKIHAQRN